MPSSSRHETFQSGRCSIALRRVHGPDATELFFSCSPASDHGSAAQQADAVYRAISELLTSEGAGLSCLVSETVFFASIHKDREAVTAARNAVLAASLPTPGYALTELEQAPLLSDAALEVLVHAIIPRQGWVASRCVSIASGSDAPELRGTLVSIGDDTRFYAGNLYGQGADAYEQTQAVFRAAEKLLHEAGLDFSDVMRTWLYFSAMERDYDGFNRARREFFQSRNVDPIPASTGIGAGLWPPRHSIGLGLYAVRGSSISRTVMTTPTLNEAPDYGSDFSRGMRVEESNRRSLHISGTASLDHHGASVHLDDFDAQVDRMLLNVKSLLQEQDAGFGDIVSAITYLKRPEDAPKLQSRLEAAGYTGFPNVVVCAPVCRPELLCETEALAIQPTSKPAGVQDG